MTSTNEPQELSQEELEAYMERLRDADATEVLVQAFTMLGTGAEVKLGRPDARLLIDAMAALANAAGSSVSDDLAKGMQNSVAQLQMGQVQIERQTSQQEGGTGAEQAEGAQQPPSAPPPQEPGTREQSMTDRLWIPGRDPGPPRPRR